MATLADLIKIGTAPVGATGRLASLPDRLEQMKRYDADFADYLKLGMGTYKNLDTILSTPAAWEAAYNAYKSGEDIAAVVKAAKTAAKDAGLSGTAIGDLVNKYIPYVDMGVGLYDVLRGNVNPATIPSLASGAAGAVGGTAAAGAAANATALVTAPLVLGNIGKMIFGSKHDSFQNLNEFMHPKSLSRIGKRLWGKDAGELPSFIREDDGYWYYLPSMHTENSEHIYPIRYNPENNTFEYLDREFEEVPVSDMSEAGEHKVPRLKSETWRPALLTEHHNSPWMMGGHNTFIPVKDLAKELLDSGFTPSGKDRVDPAGNPGTPDIAEALTWLKLHPTFTHIDNSKHSMYTDATVPDSVKKLMASADKLAPKHTTPTQNSTDNSEKTMTDQQRLEEWVATHGGLEDAPQGLLNALKQDTPPTPHEPSHTSDENREDATIGNRIQPPPSPEDEYYAAVRDTQQGLEELFGLQPGDLQGIANQIKDALTQVKKTQGQSINRYGMKLIPKGAQAAAQANLMSLLQTYNPYENVAQLRRTKQALLDKYLLDKGLNEQQRQIALERLGVAHDYDLDTLAKKHGYDIDTLGVTHNYDLDTLAKKHGYDLEETSNRYEEYGNMLKDYQRYLKDNELGQYAEPPSLNQMQRAQSYVSSIGGFVDSAGRIFDAANKFIGLAQKMFPDAGEEETSAPDTGLFDSGGLDSPDIGNNYADADDGYYTGGTWWGTPGSSEYDDYFDF